MYILNHLLLKKRYSEEMNNEKVESVVINKDDRSTIKEVREVITHRQDLGKELQDSSSYS